ncbi:protein-export chaperone SecB [Rhodophyticola sp. CCM32]|uniref:protein-export chaperone SecB n=1 Tax=Rhodophyticola sp. CCM32 TaxID=2916397 RepID=UPI00107F7E95|nr:protein-export chaperone SecB [Rhodophyticola sp. CCM32]QBY02066.1 protein-export chaperone SecB [Rhodophyticola sp. CCM32]
MAEENGAAAPTPNGQAVPPRMQILGQFIRDLSFENIAAQKSVQTQTQPDIQVQVALDARKREQDNQFDVIVKLKIDSKTKDDDPQPIFLIELDYVGIFQVENVPQEQLHPFLMIECPRMLFPFLRRIVSDITRDGGFPPLNLENMDFLSIYRNELSRRAEAKKTADA